MNKIIFCAGRITESKGIQYTIEALKYLPDKYIILIAGWGDYVNTLREISKDLGLLPRVHFLGRIQYEDMGTYYALIDVFSHFPTFYEPFGRTLIEAMSFGKPVVAYPIAGIKDIVRNNHNGLLVKSRYPKVIAENIKKLLEEKSLYLMLSRNAKKTVREMFSNTVVVNNYIKNYKEVLKRSF